MSVKLWRVVRYAADGRAGEEGDGREEMRGSRPECLAWLRARRAVPQMYVDIDGRECAHESMAEGCGGWVLEEVTR